MTRKRLAAKIKAKNKGEEARDEAIKKQQDKYVAKTHRQDKGWSFSQFGRRTRNWNRMSEAGKK